MSRKGVEVEGKVTVLEERGAAVAQDHQVDYGCHAIRQLEVGLVEPNPGRFRKLLKGMDSLTASVKEKGVQVPIKVLQRGDGKYRIVYGERRWRASVAAGLQYIPAIVVESGEQNVDEVCLIENTHRESLPLVDEVMALREFKVRGYSRKQIASLSGRSEFYVSQAVTVAKFLKNAFASGFLTYDEVVEMEMPMKALYHVAKAVKKNNEDAAYGAELLRRAHAERTTVAELDDEMREEKYRRQLEEEYLQDQRQLGADVKGEGAGPLFDAQQQPARDKDKILGTGAGGKSAVGSIELVSHPDPPVKEGGRQKGNDGEVRSGLSGRTLLKHLSRVSLVMDYVAEMKVNESVVTTKKKITKLADDIAARLLLAGSKIKALKRRVLKS